MAHMIAMLFIDIYYALSKLQLVTISIMKFEINLRIALNRVKIFAPSNVMTILSTKKIINKRPL